MKTQITQQANGKYSIYSDSGPEVSMSDERLYLYDLSSEEVNKLKNLTTEELELILDKL